MQIERILIYFARIQTRNTIRWMELYNNIYISYN